MKIFINKKMVECNEGDLLIDVMLKNSIEIPHFCYHEDIGADGNCRMCMVEIKGAKRPQVACDTFVCEDMQVYTNSANITEVKRSILELELLNHPVDCPICDQAGECKLQDYYMDYGLYESRLRTKKTQKGKHIDLGSNVMLDQERCVLCTRCVRFTSNMTKTGELGVVGRGDSARIAVAPGRELNNPYAMNVVELCPVGALTSKDFRFQQRVWFLDSAKSICHGCSRGCNIYIDYNQTKYSNEKIHRFRSRKNNDINKSFLCDHGRLSYKELNKPYSGKVSSIGELKELLSIEKKVALASPSLSYEQLEAIQELCRLKEIELFSLPYTDENFKDDWLKTDDRSANFGSVVELGINHDEDELFGSLMDAELIINFDYTSLREIELLNKRIVDFTTSISKEGAELVYTFANFAHESGTLINCDGIKQKFFATKYKAATPRLVNLLAELK